MPAQVLQWDGVSAWARLIGSVTVEGDRTTLVYGSYKPTPGDSAGNLPNSTFTTQAGDFTAVADTTYQNVDFQGLVTTGAAGVVFKNCIFRGQTAAPSSAVFCVKSNNGDMAGAKFYDCLFEPQVQSWWSNGIGGGNYEMYRCEIRKCVDGIDLTAPTTGPTIIKGNVIHDGTYYSWVAPETGDGHSDGHTHNDAIQFSRGKNITILGNYIGGVPSADDNPSDGTDFPNSGIMLQQEVSSTQADMIENVTISQNWFEGGVCSLNTATKYGNTFPTTSITNNRFIRRTSGYYLIEASLFSGTISGNVIDDDGSPVPITNGA